MAKWRNTFKKYKNDDLKHRHENVVCKNCETKFSGKYCPECGQAVRDYDQPFTFIFYNFMGDFFAFDTRFLRTFGALLVKPGFLTSEYFKGRRVKYAPPFRIYIFISFVLFFLFQIYSNRGLTSVLDKEISNKNISLIDSVPVNMADSILNEVQTEMDTLPVGNFKLDLADLGEFRDLRAWLNKLAARLEVELANETDPARKEKLREYIMLSNYPQQAVARILKYLSWAFFILLPIFAFILKLTYIRRKQNYMRHLVFSIHLHSFIFVVLTIIVSLKLITNIDLNIITAILFFSIPVYFIIALKKFYGQSILKVIMKFIFVSFLYNIVFFIAVGYVFANALSLI